MKVTYDAEARAAYIYLGDYDDRRASHARTVEIQRSGRLILADLDHDGAVMGIELLGVDAPTIEARKRGASGPGEAP